MTATTASFGYVPQPVPNARPNTSAVQAKRIQARHQPRQDHHQRQQRRRQPRESEPPTSVSSSTALTNDAGRLPDPRVPRKGHHRSPRPGPPLPHHLPPEILPQGQVRVRQLHPEPRRRRPHGQEHGARPRRVHPRHDARPAALAPSRGVSGGPPADTYVTS